MAVTKKHVEHVSPWLESWMLDCLEKVGRQIFSFADEPKFVLMSPLLGSVPGHAHYVATDLNPMSDDFHQILGTPWLRVVDV